MGSFSARVALLALFGILQTAQHGIAAPSVAPRLVFPDAIVAAETISFWGRPFPYGYTGWGPCVRYERVETERGVAIYRRWICNPSDYRRRRSH